jgi:hypothetical protein
MQWDEGSPAVEVSKLTWNGRPYLVLRATRLEQQFAAADQSRTSVL